MNTPPRSAYDEVGGMLYFPRMLDKIRLFAKGELRSDFHANLGNGADGWICNFIQIDYEALRIRTLEGGQDEGILDWCYKQGRELNDTDLMVWNAFVTKLGWRDKVSAMLVQRKAESGLADRDDIQTMPDYFEVDEGRKS